MIANLHPTTPNLTDIDGNVWVYAPLPHHSDADFARRYVCGKREAKLMAYANGGPRKLWGKSGEIKLLTNLEVAA